jgi:hypothetical protein
MKLIKWDQTGKVAAVAAAAVMDTVNSRPMAVGRKRRGDGNIDVSVLVRECNQCLVI